MTEHTITESSQDWLSQFREMYDQAVHRFEQGHRGPETVVGREALAFLDSIGTSAQELYDFVEDWVEDGEPGFDAVAAMTDVRRTYFLTVQEGKPSDQVIPSATLPSGGAELGGYRWLPRIIAKARAKLRGGTRTGSHVRLRCRPAVPAERKHGTGRILEHRVERRHG